MGLFSIFYFLLYFPFIQFLVQVSRGSFIRNSIKALISLIFFLLAVLIYSLLAVSVSSLYIHEETETHTENINFWCYPFEGVFKFAFGETVYLSIYLSCSVLTLFS